MQITATLSGSTAIIALKGGNTNTTLTIKDAASLASDLAPFASGDAPAVDASSSLRTGPEAVVLSAHIEGTPFPTGRSSIFGKTGATFEVVQPDKRTVQVHPRGYILNPTDNGVQIITPAGTAQGEGKVSIPRDQIAGLVAQLNA